MKLSKLILLIICFWSSYVWSGNPREKLNSTSNQTAYEQEVNKLLVSLHKITKVPGYSVTVVHQGKTVASVATGFTDLSKQISTTEESIFRLASVSKVIGATMLAELVIDGRLDPDAEIGRYIPRLNKRYRKITVRQLVSHTSGMPHYQAKDYDIYDKHYESASQAISTLKGRSLLSEPGADYYYSSHGYTLAGAVYEYITKQPLSVGVPDFVKRWTGRNTPIIEDVLALPSNTSNLYRYSADDIVNEEFGEKSYSVFGAGLSSTSLDLAHLGYQVLNKSKHNPSYQKLLFSPALTSDGEPVATPNYQVGFGWRIGTDMQGRIVYHHAGATPGARSVLVLYPEFGLSISILSNVSWVAGIDKMAYSIGGLYLDQAKPVTIQPNTKYSAVFAGAKFTGRISCNNTNCFLENEQTSYSKWQNKFNSTAEYIDDWPIYSYSSAQGDRLLMVSKTGIYTLLSEDGRYQVPINQDKIYSVQLIE